MSLTSPNDSTRPAVSRARKGLSPTWAALGAVTLLGAVLRVSYVHEPMRWDEALVFYWVETWHPLRIAVNYDNIGNHILYTFSMLASTTLFGDAPWSVRLPALLPGIALIPATFLAVSCLVPRPVALMTAGLAAGSPYLVFYSVNSRGYMLHCLLVLALLWLLVRQVETPSRRWTVASGAAGGLALYTLPTTILLLPGLYCGVGLRAILNGTPHTPRVVVRGLAEPMLLTAGLATLLYLPVLVMSWFQPLDVFVTRALPPVELWRTLQDSIRDVLARWSWDLPPVGRILFAIAAVAGALGLTRRERGAAALVLLVITTSVAASIVLQRVPPARGYLFLMPFFLVLAAAGIRTILEWCRLPEARCAPLIAVALAAGGLAWTWSGRWIESSDETGRIAGAEAAMVALAETMGPRDRIAPEFPQLRYYARLHDLPVRFIDYDLGLDGVDRLYVAVRTHRETLDETLDGRLDRGAGTLDAFGEPVFVGPFPDLRIFVMERR